MAEKHFFDLRRVGACASLGVGALLGGCAGPSQGDAQLDVPQVVAHAPLFQKSTRALQHWNVLAGDVATHLAQSLSDWPKGSYPMQLTLEPGASGFERGLHELLLTQLVEHGLAVSTAPQELRLRVYTQVVQHHANAPLVGAAPQELAHGVRVWRGVDGGSSAARVMPGDDAPMRSEILVITSLERAGEVLVRTSDMYSIAQADVPLYQNRGAHTAGADAGSGALRQWQVVP